MYIIYKHTNQITGKSYVGQTKQSLNRRWCQHVADASYENKRGYTSHFRKALRKYGSEVWEHEILEEGLDKIEADLREIHWIFHYNTYYAGYNSTLGGCNAPISDETRKKLSEANKGRIHSPEVRAAAKIRNTGKGNPMYGKSQSDKAKKAVSDRVRSEADKTLRTWVHLSGIVEKDITCLALRDKYPELLISKLNAVAKELKNKKGYLIGVSHKGWSLELLKKED